MVASELVDVVDIDDKPVGRATVKDCTERGLLHRAVAVLVIRSGGRYLLQRRSRKDRWHPGRWTLSCTGHVKADETYTDAARRELSEELGIRARLTPFSKFLLPPMKSRGLTEWEQVFLFVTKTDAKARPDPLELDDARDMNRQEVRAMMKGRRLTPDAKLLLGEYFRSVGDDAGASVRLQGLGRHGQ